MKTAAALILLTLVPTTALVAQADLQPVPGTPQRWYFSPYTRIAGAALLTGILLETDQQTYNTIHAWKMNNPSIKTLSPVVTQLGNGVFAVSLFGGMGAYSILWKDEKALHVATLGLESFAFTGIACQILKQSFSRERPMASTRSGGFWSGPFAYFDKSRGHGKGIASFDAFPSGHTTTAFSVATVLSDAYDASWVPYVSYSFAGLVGVSRIMECEHWASDCFVGALLGYYGTKLVERWNTQSSPISIVPQMHEHSLGLSFNAHL